LNKIRYAAVALAAPLFAGVGMLAFQAPASAATINENQFGVLIRLETGRIPAA
jgi:hypothetical protein